MQNPALAAYWYSRAAHLNEPEAQYNLGCCYEVGVGLSVGGAAALRWYQRAAESGSSRAMHRLAWAYREGEFGLPVDEAEAWRLLELAEEQGLDIAEQTREKWS